MKYIFQIPLFDQIYNCFIEQVVLSIGTVSSILFHLFVPHEDRPAYFPPPPVAAPPTDDDQAPAYEDGAGAGAAPLQRRVKLTVGQWLKQPQIDQVAIVYLATRLFVNLSQAYIPLYLQVQY